MGQMAHTATHYYLPPQPISRRTKSKTKAIWHISSCTHRMQKLSLCPGYFQSHMLVSRIAGERETVGTGLRLKQHQQHDLYTGLLIITGKHKYKDAKTIEKNKQTDKEKSQFCAGLLKSVAALDLTNNKKH